MLAEQVSGSIRCGCQSTGSIGRIALGYGFGSLDRDEVASRMRALQRKTSPLINSASGRIQSLSR